MSGQDELGPCHVLVVEDELLIALDLCGKLEVMGCTPIGPAASVEDALALIDSCHPDIALLDENLGGAPATPVAEALRRRHIPFAVVSGYTRERSVLREAPRIGKPATTEIVRDMVRRLRWPVRR